MAEDVASLVDAITKAAKTYNHVALEHLCTRFRNAAYSQEVKPGQTKVVLRALRSLRAFQLMRRVADASLASGVDDPQIVRQYAQALIDSGDLVAAKAMLENLQTSLGPSHKEYAEASGLLGRMYKQMYVERAKAGAPADLASLSKAIEPYLTVYQADRENTWHGVNAMALLDRGQRDGLTIEGPASTELATEISEHIQGLWDDGDASAWDLATAMEACVALGDREGAMQWLGLYVEEPKIGSFELSGTTRQLQEVWQVGTDSEMYGLLEILQARILEREGGGRIVDTTPGSEARLDPAAGLEKTFGTIGAKSVEWLRDLLDRRLSVARIEHEDHEPVGTAWIVRGGDIVESFGDELMLLTNSHVVSREPVLSETLSPDDAWANFTYLNDGARFQVDRVVFESPQRQYDVALLKMQNVPENVPPLKVSKRLPLADGEQRVYVVGHPKGGDIKISIDDNVLLDHDGTKLHYRAPTEPGSSGSPVFNKKLRVIALHHAGRDDMPKLNDKEGRYQANEGISLNVICDAAATAAPTM
jgi:hypothetical protein